MRSIRDVLAARVALRHALLLCLGLALSCAACRQGVTPAPATATALPSATAAPPTATPAPPLYAPNQRFGFGISRRVGDVTLYDVALLHAGWYVDWSYAADPPRPAGLEYAQLVPVGRGVRVDQGRVREVALAQPGSLWLLGNEPERRALRVSSATDQYADLTPDEYATIYHELYQVIKQADPTAQIAVGGVVQPSPLRLRWLDLVLESYQFQYGAPMPVDVWNIHIQIMREKLDHAGCDGCWGADIPRGIEDVQEGLMLEIEDNADLEKLKGFVWAFRRWMKERGQQDKPLIISEYGVLMPSEYLGKTKDEGDEVVRRFMVESFDFFLETRDVELGYPQDQYRLVQRWAWYSLNEVPYQYSEALAAWIGFNGGLFDWQEREWPGALTPLGQAFADYTRALREEP